jgi:hypothetical protein
MFDDQRLENPIHIPIPFIGDPVMGDKFDKSPKKILDP